MSDLPVIDARLVELSPRPTAAIRVRQPMSTVDVGASELPGGRAARTVHRGPYPTLGDAYSSLHDWIHAQGHDEGDGPWESYVDNPAEVADLAQLRTEITWPVTDR